MRRVRYVLNIHYYKCVNIHEYVRICIVRYLLTSQHDLLYDASPSLRTGNCRAQTSINLAVWRCRWKWWRFPAWGLASFFANKCVLSVNPPTFSPLYLDLTWLVSSLKLFVFGPEVSEPFFHSTIMKSTHSHLGS